MFDHILRTIGAAIIIMIVWGITEILFFWIAQSSTFLLFFFIFSWVVGSIGKYVYDDIYLTAKVRTELFANIDEVDDEYDVEEDDEWEDELEDEWEDEDDRVQSSNKKSSNKKSSYSTYEPSSSYKAQYRKRNMTSWWDVCPSTFESAAINHADNYKSRNPDAMVRVVEVKNGRIVGTIYSC